MQILMCQTRIFPRLCISRICMCWHSIKVVEKKGWRCAIFSGSIKEITQMDVAHCTLNGERYTVRQFEGLSEHDVAQLRRFLACPVCAGPAFYRKESTSGQAACFGARPHAPGCSLAAAEPRYRGGAGPDQVERINSGERIEIDFVYGAGPVTHVNPNEPANPQGRGGRFVGGGSGPRNAVMHRRLSTLLKNLMHSDGFRNSDQLIAMPAGEFRVRTFLSSSLISTGVMKGCIAGTGA